MHFRDQFHTAAFQCEAVGEPVVKLADCYRLTRELRDRIEHLESPLGMPDAVMLRSLVAGVLHNWRQKSPPYGPLLTSWTWDAADEVVEVVRRLTAEDSGP